MRIEHLTHEHIISMELQPEQQLNVETIKSKEFFKAVTDSRLPSFACIKNDEVIGCYGTQLLWNGRGMVWAILSKHAGRYIREVHSIAKGYLSSLPVHRIEAYVRTGFVPGIRWAGMLGFEHECHMRKFFENGDDAELYAIVR